MLQISIRPRSQTLSPIGGNGCSVRMGAPVLLTLLSQQEFIMWMSNNHYVSSLTMKQNIAQELSKMPKVATEDLDLMLSTSAEELAQF